MKQLLSMLIFLLITGCAKQEVLITIEVQEQPDVDILLYSVPYSGITFFGFTDTLKQSEAGIFELSLKITEPSFVTIFSESDKYWRNIPQNHVKLLIEPGNNYHVTISSEKNIQIIGANEMGQMLYATLPAPEFYVDNEIRQWLYKNDTVPYISVHQQINDLKQTELSKFQKLYDNKDITKSFFDLVQKDRDCYYALLETRLLIIKSYENYKESLRLRFNIINNDDDLAEYLTKIYNQYPIHDKSLHFSTFWPGYSSFFVTEYKQFIQGDFDHEKLREFSANGTIHTHMINESKKYLSGKALEFFQAIYLWKESYNGTAKGDFAKEFVSLFEQFERDYPKSEYSKYINPFIEKIISYHQIIEQPFDKSILFMDNYETFNTLEDVIKPLQGKKIYIDVWATWCGPCKEEFKHNEALKKILAENDIKQLYISIDKDRDGIDQIWKNDIKFHNLNGLHIRANKELYDNLMKRYDKNAKEPYIAIPWYILIDEKGNIMDEHAKSPSKLVAGENLL